MKRKFCIAPMMKKTDKHFRFLSRLLSKNAYLYTEMIHSNAIIKGDANKLLSFNDCEQPVALQLGGSNPKDLGIAASIGEDFGYSEINLNVGCPSKKVKSGNFGVFLMKDKNLLSECLYEMKKNVSLPVTVKCRIGVDEFEGKDFLFNFVNEISNVGIKTFIIHARKAISGLDTKRNRSIPKLNYKIVKDKVIDESNLKEEDKKNLKKMAAVFRSNLLWLDGEAENEIGVIRDNHESEAEEEQEVEVTLKQQVDNLLANVFSANGDVDKNVEKQLFELIQNHLHKDDKFEMHYEIEKGKEITLESPLFITVLTGITRKKAKRAKKFQYWVNLAIYDNENKLITRWSKCQIRNSQSLIQPWENKEWECENKEFQESGIKNAIP